MIRIDEKLIKEYQQAAWAVRDLTSEFRRKNATPYWGTSPESKAMQQKYYCAVDTRSEMRARIVSSVFDQLEPRKDA